MRKPIAIIISISYLVSSVSSVGLRNTRCEQRNTNSALRPMASKVTDIKPAKADTPEREKIEENLSTLENLAMIDAAERKLLEIIAFEGPYRRRVLKNIAYDKGIAPRNRRLFNVLLDGLVLRKRLIIKQRNKLYLNQESIEELIDEGIAHRIIEPFVEELKEMLKSESFPTGKIDEEGFCNLLKRNLERLAQTYRPLSQFGFDKKWYRHFYQSYQSQGKACFIKEIQHQLIMSYRLQRNIERLLNARIYPIMASRGLPMRIDKIIFTYDDMNPRPLKWLVVKKNKRLLRHYNLLEKKRGQHALLLINSPVLQYAAVRLNALFLLLTHVVAGHPAFNHKGVLNFRTPSLKRRLQEGIEDNPYLEGLEFDFSYYPQDEQSIENILMAIDETVAHKVTFILSEGQDITKGEIRRYIDSLVRIYIVERARMGLIRNRKRKIKGAHFAHIAAIAEIKNIDSELINDCVGQSIRFNGKTEQEGRAYHERLVQDLIKFYDNLKLKNQEFNNPAPRDVTRRLQKKFSGRNAIAKSA